MLHHAARALFLSLAFSAGGLLALGCSASSSDEPGLSGQVDASDGAAADANTDTGKHLPDAAASDAGSDASVGDGGKSDGAADGATSDASDAGVPDAADAGSVDAAVFCNALDDPHELISDRRFRRGFVPLDQQSGQPSGKMPSGFCSGEPIWNIAQWDSLGDLGKATRQTLPNGSVRWGNDYGRITVGKIDNADADMGFGVWAFKEYNGQYHTPSPDRVWVHLLAEQRISPPGVTNPGCPRLSSLSKLTFKMAAQLLKDDPNYQNGYDKTKHAAQFLIYFTVQNLKQGSPGFTDYLWFGLMPYDDRYDLPGTYILGDLSGAMGTGKLIYNIGAKPFISTGMKAGGSEQMFVKDVLPDIRAALLEAWKRGYLPGSNVLSDYKIGGMNIGWEVPGLNDVEMRVRDLSLRYEEKPTTPVVFSFDKEGMTDGWTAHNMTDLNGGPVNGKWVLQVPGDDPYIVSPVLNLDAASHKTLHMQFANDGNPVSTSKMRVYWERFGDTGGFREAWSVTLPVSNGGGWQNLDIDMSANPAWTGEIKRIRIDPIVKGDGHAVGFDDIRL